MDPTAQPSSGLGWSEWPGLVILTSLLGDAFYLCCADDVVPTLGVVWRGVLVEAVVELHAIKPTE